jgi:flagellum-specific ATP synthase
VKRLLADYAEAEDIINAGLYKEGSNAAIDAAVAKRPAIEAFLTQAVDERGTLEETLTRLAALADADAASGEEGAK